MLWEGIEKVREYKIMYRFNLLTMKKALIILSLFFLALWIVALFYSNRTGSIHVALLVGLLLFVRSFMVIEPAINKETDSTNTQL